MTREASNRSRARAVLVAAAAGDALGWPQEARGGIVGGRKSRESRKPQAVFESWIRNGGTRFARYKDPVDAGAYSDDTQLTLAVARSCLVDESWVTHLTRSELPAWPLYQRGGGRAVLSAAHAWAEGRLPWSPRPEEPRSGNNAYFAAGANGVAMRIAPHVIWTNARDGARDLGVLFKRVVQDGVTTHGHPRALVGALAYAAALHLALDAPGGLGPADLSFAAHEGLIDAEEVHHWLPSSWFETQQKGDFLAAWRRTNDEMANLLDIIRSSLRQGSMSDVGETLRALGALGEFSGAGTVSAAAAIYLASRSGTRPVNGLLQAAFQHGADTDTVASMTGGLLGAIHGEDWLGQLRTVQDGDYIVQLADALLNAEGRVGGAPPVPPKVVARALDQNQEYGSFADGRRYEVVARVLLSERPWVVRLALRLEDGQTVQVDRVRKTPPLELPDHLEHSPVMETGASRSSDLPAGSISAKEAPGVTLLATDFEAVVQFYRHILTDGLTLSRDMVVVTPWLRFTRSAVEAALWTADAKIDLAVPDLTATAKKLNAPITKDAYGRKVTVSDPEGRLVTIREA